MIYPDRIAAGRLLGESLGEVLSREGVSSPRRRSRNRVPSRKSAPSRYPLLLGLPRGGVPVAVGVRAVVGGDLDVLLVRKLGVPWQPELAVGAIGESGIRVLNGEVLRQTEVTPAQLAATEDLERAELNRRERLIRGRIAAVPLRDRCVVIVDDGMATGATVVAACLVARGHRPHRLIVAVPVSSADALRRLRGLADETVCPCVPRVLGGVGAFYQDFHQLEDAEMLDLLDPNPLAHEQVSPP